MKAVVLVVDDEPDIVQSMKDVLRLHYEVYGASSFKEAMKVIDEHKIDTVILDLNLPDTHGVDTIGTLQAAHPDVAILAFTGYPWMTEELGHGDVPTVVKGTSIQKIFTALIDVRMRKIQEKATAPLKEAFKEVREEVERLKKDERSAS